ncbi:MAG: hypothetical protein GY839_15250, partial [candidate division Zixibacteria bacterium]|nr:hypothetical protein [candidate division Zixibacteria bacterium]
VDGSLKYDLVAQPGADISRIEIQYEGIVSIAVGQDGALNIDTQFGNLRENQPYVYQDTDGRRQSIKGRYIIRKPGVYGFAIEGPYDQTQPLIIDPELVYSSYLGGIGWEESNGIATGPDGSIYITGNTYSMDFPLESPYDSTLEFIEDADVFITRFAPDGGSLIYSTYLGSEDFEISYDIAVDSAGNCYITGKTGSEDFPMVNAYDSSLAGEDDVFVAKLSAAGDSLLYSTYLGGAVFEQGRVIALGNNGDIYVTGYTNSPDFPTFNAYDYSHNGGNDAFVACLTAAGGLSYCTYLGGSNPDYPYGMVIDSSGNAHIAGCTGSTDFPTANAYNENSNGLYDVFITTLAAPGDSLIYSTYVGGGNDDYGWGIALDTNGDIIFGGGTTSADFPMVNPIDGGFNGYYDAFVAKFNASGDSLVYSTYLGGIMYDEVWGLVIDDVGNAIITGGTSSSNFPTTLGAFDEEHNGSYDVFMAQISNSGDSLLYSTYIGGYDPDYGFDICVDDEGNIYITGRSRTPDFPMVNAFDSTHNGYYDAIILKFENIISQKYIPGDANMYLGAWPPSVIGGDVTYMVNYFRGMITSQACLLDGFWCSADANGDCLIIGSDVTRLVNYFRGMTELGYCADYEPAWPALDDLPVDAPVGWPNCNEMTTGKIAPTGALK